MNSIFTRIVFCACVCGSLSAADKTGVERMEWQIDGVAREALVHVPADARSSATPVLFAFHGHGGTAKNAAFHYNYQKLWPEALVVYMQGLPTVGKTDPETIAVDEYFAGRSRVAIVGTQVVAGEQSTGADGSGRARTR